ncbi:MAG: hypothetical protein Barrevirus22_4 [Barrevirus sp.]|uniref:Uncharacterized protein n=1 Tax=Barrevirus sp. TaxID=2487763 RepID=A0A3G4ZQQ9_9VIRU|nr:MAG: hypothetical protein Barrevirus22_4 [Barrevirus sp.]
MKGPKHETVQLWSERFDEHIDIDRNIAPLIYELWKANIDTNNSCENNTPEIYGHKDTCIWIQFATDDDFYKFISIIFKGISRNSDFFARTACQSKCKLKWKYSLLIWEDEECYMMEYIDISYSIRFPGCDYAYVLQKICNYNKQMNKNDIAYNKLVGSKTKKLSIVLEVCDAIINVNYDKYIHSYKHHYETVKLYYKRLHKIIDIDRNISELISELWEEDIDTVRSSSTYTLNNNDKYIWIEFYYYVDFSNFIKIILKDEEVGNEFCTRVYYPYGDDHWTYIIDMDRNPEVEDDALDCKLDKKYWIKREKYQIYNCVNTIHISYSVIFPKQDYKYVLKKFKNYNKNNLKKYYL